MAYRCDGKKTIEECLHCPFPDCIAAPRDLANYGTGPKAKTWDGPRTTAHKRARKRELYEMRKMLGLCGMCGKAPAVTGYIQCEACRAKAARYRAMEREKKEAAKHG